MSFKTFTSDPNRRGIGEAVAKIGVRISAGETSTAIVMPPRYGKSNIIRLAAIEMMETAVIGSAIALVPWVALRDQLTNREKIQKMVADMNVKAAIDPSLPMTKLVSGSISTNFFREAFRYLWTMTIHAAHQKDTKIILRDTAIYCQQVWKRPLLVMIDECQYVSDHPSSGWGTTARDLATAGAHVVLLTGTPDRADNIAPFGFKVTEINRDDGVESKVLVRRRIENGKKLGDLQTRIADTVTYQLNADLTVTLQEAWETEIIARIQARWFGVKVDNADLADIDDRTEAKRLLAKALRENQVEEEAVAIFVEEMAIRRKTRPTTAGIIFVGTDREFEGKNEQARRIQAKCEKLWRAQFGSNGDIQIATLANATDDKAKPIIDRFVGGHGDVLIVKSMGGVGLDVERLKVALDLSTVRTQASATQRWLRIATIWPGIKHGTLILPEDAVTRSLFQEIVTEHGGDFVVTENMTVIDEETIELQGDDLSEPVFGDAYASGASNQDGVEVEEIEMADITRAISDYPGIADRFEYTELAELIRQGAFPARPAAEKTTTINTSPVVDVDQQKRDLHDDIGKVWKDLVQIIRPYEGARAGNAAEYQRIRQQVMGKAKLFAGISKGIKLKQCHDIQKLEAVRDFLKHELENAVSFRGAPQEMEDAHRVSN